MHSYIVLPFRERSGTEYTLEIKDTKRRDLILLHQQNLFGLSFSCLFFRVFIPLSRLYLFLSFFNYIIASFFQSTVVGLPGLCQNLAVFPVAVEQRYYHALAPIQRQNMAENFAKDTQERNKCAPAILVQVKKYVFSSLRKRKQCQF